MRSADVSSCSIVAHARQAHAMRSEINSRKRERTHPLGHPLMMHMQFVKACRIQKTKNLNERRDRTPEALKGRKELYGYRTSMDTR
jgi:hypothetical protein